MSEEKKQSDDKKYAQISREFVRHCGDAVGITQLALEIAVLLAEDSNYRLRETIQNAGQFMRHDKRKKLASEDFNKALRWSDVEPIYGYSLSDPLPFIHVKEAEVFCTEDHEINLVVMANAKHAFDHPKILSLKAQWMAVEGCHKGVAPSSSSSAPAKKNGTVATPVSEDLMSYYNQVTKAILGNNEEVTRLALDDLKVNPKIAPLLPFFINFVSVGVKKVSHDLMQLTKLLHTVSSLTNNRYLYLGPHPISPLLVQGVLYCIVEPLAASLNPINDHWALRDYAARLLTNIVSLWHTPVNRLYDHTLQSLEEVFTDFTKPFCSHYGAVVAMMTLGVEAVKSSLYPNLTRYWPHLIAVLEDTSVANVPFKADAHKVYGAILLASEFLILHMHEDLLVESLNSDIEGVADSVQLAGRGLDSSSILNPAVSESGSVPIKIKEEPMDHEPIKTEASDKAVAANQPDHSVPGERSPSLDAYCQLYEYFGDSLAARLPYVHLRDFYAEAEPELVNLFRTPELMQTGEQLLEAFVVAREEEAQSNSVEDDRYSYEDHDDNSLMSDDGDVETEPTDVDLRIKSTVSDPIQGIKLTITKLPRAPPAAPPTHHGEPAKVITKLSIKIPKEQLVQPEPEPPAESRREEEDEERGGQPFESVALRPRCMYIDLNFEGSTPTPSHKLKRKHPGGHPYYRAVFDSNVHRIGLRMKATSRKRRGRVGRAALRQRLTRAFCTGNLLTAI